MVLTALFALIDHGSTGWGTAVDDGVDDLSVIQRHGVTEAVDILMGVFFEDFIYFHGHLLSSVS